MQIDIKTLAAVVGLVLVIGLFVRMITGPRKPASPTPVNGDGTLPPPGKRPAPTFVGILFTKPAYDEGERIPLIVPVSRPILPTDGPCAVQRGFVDNGSGPYKVRVWAFRKSDGHAVPVYKGDVGPECSGVDLEPSAEVVVYANAVRPYGAIGSLVNCGEFVPLDTPTGAKVKCGDATTTVPPGNITGATDGMTLHFQIVNADGVESPVWEQSVGVVPSTCGRTKTKKTR